MSMLMPPTDMERAAKVVVFCPKCGWRGPAGEANFPPDDVVTCKTCDVPVMRSWFQPATRPGLVEGG